MKSIFYQSKFLSFFSRFLLGSIDVIISALNLLRLMLLRGKHKHNAIDIWNPDNFANIKKKIEDLTKKVSILISTDTLSILTNRL